MQYGISGEDDRRLIVRPDDGDRPGLLAHPRVSVPPYLGGAGWIGLDLVEEAAPDPVDWDEVTELVADSYRRVALVRMRTALDGR